MTWTQIEFAAVAVACFFVILYLRHRRDQRRGLGASGKGHPRSDIPEWKFYLWAVELVAIAVAVCIILTCLAHPVSKEPPLFGPIPSDANSNQASGLEG